MKRLGVGIVTIALGFLVALGQARGETEQDFAFVFNSPHNPDPSQFSLYGRHPLNQRVHLLAQQENAFCAATTLKYDEFKAPVGAFEFTILRPSAACKRPSNYSVAFFGRVTEYQIVRLQPISEQRVIASVDREFRESPAMASLRNKAQDTFPGEKIAPLDAFKPKLLRFNSRGLSGSVLSYEKTNKDWVDGPRALWIKDKVYPLTGWCSYPYLRAFVLNRSFYFESGSYCCGCCITFRELFQLDAAGVRVVLVDGSGSD